MFLIIVFIFISGLFLGSFLNVAAECLMNDKSFIIRRSCCPNCKYSLSILDLIPLVSFIILGGKCRYCRKKISWQYPIMELATGILLGFSVFFLPPPSLNPLIIIPWLYTFFIISVLEIIFLIDLKYGLILDRVVFPAVAVVLAFYLFMTGSQIWLLYQGLLADANGFGAYLLQTDFLRNRIIFSLIPLGFSLAGSLGLAILFLLVIFLTRGRGMGGGDVRLVFLVGLITGWPGMLTALFLSFLTGAIVSVMLILIGKKHFGQTVPFGPFLVTSTLITMFWGQQILDWYLKLF